MGHHHHHHHEVSISNINKALILGILLNTGFVILEIIAGIWYDSLALLSDAGHNFSDVIALMMALAAFKLLAIAPTETYTYGYRKTTVWAAIVNAILLMVAVGMIFWESIDRWFHPLVIDGKTTALVAMVGIVINGLTAWLFLKDKEKDLNIKGAYLHMLADMLVSVGVVISSLIVLWTGWYRVDTIATWAIVGMIIISTWALFKDSIRLGLDGVPSGIDLGRIQLKILKVEGVMSVHHIHIWGLSTTENAMTGHLVIAASCTFEDAANIKNKIKHLLQHEGIQHVTLELEKENEACSAQHCNIVHEKEEHHHCHHHHH